MVALTLSEFSGALPIKDLRLLPNEAAVRAVNLDTSGGSLKPNKAPSLIKSLLSTTKFVYKLPYNNVGTPIEPSDMLAARWLEFSDAFTTVARTPNINDSFERYYWCNPTDGLRYATLASLLASGTGASKNVGIEVPLTALSVAATGGTTESPTVTRSYMQTYVSIYGEEGQPGPTFEATGKTDGDWTITSIDQPVNAAGNTTVDRIRIYRTITSSSGVTTFFRVQTFAIGTTVYLDNLSDVTVSGNQQIESTLWAPPPEGLQGIVAMPNGIFVGFKGNTLYFSENFRPHAWPAEYALTVQFPIVGLGVFGTTCVVCTTGNPATVTGIRSSVMALTQSKSSIPCLSRQSIVSTLEGVYYATTEGLALITPGGNGIVTKDVISRDQWLNDFEPTEIKAVFTNNNYAALRSVRGFQLTAAGVIETDAYVDAVAVGIDELSNTAWLIDDGFLYQWEPADGDDLKYTWLSKEVRLPRLGNMSVCQAFFDGPGGQGDIHLRVWADGYLIYDHDLRVSGEEYRLPSGFKAHVWQVELSGYSRLHNFIMASSPMELRNV